jgi:hypothetical protein
MAQKKQWLHKLLGSADDSSGALLVEGTFSADPPVGGATETKQNTQIVQLTTMSNATNALLNATNGGYVRPSTGTLWNVSGPATTSDLSNTQLALTNSQNTVISALSVMSNTGNTHLTSTNSVMVAAQNLDLVVSASSRITHTGSSENMVASLANGVPSITIPSNLRAVYLIPDVNSAAVYYNMNGAANSNTSEWVRDSRARCFTHNSAANTNTIGTSNQKSTVELMTPRN